MISNDRLLALWNEFSSQPPRGWADWIARYEAFVDRIAALPDEELRAPAMQEELWRDKSVTGVGPGESVSVTDGGPRRGAADRELVHQDRSLHWRCCSQGWRAFWRARPLAGGYPSGPIGIQARTPS